MALAHLRALPLYIRDLNTLKRQRGSGPTAFPLDRFYPCLDDRLSESGAASGHYFHQDLLAASRVFQNNPVRHIDVGSRIDGFVAHVASFRAVDVVDIRPLSSRIRNVTFIQLDLMQPLKAEFAACCDSLSCLHALEHFGLGRYGDSVNDEGHLIGFANLRRMVRPGGTFYFSVPIGPQRLEFNAHRVFSVRYLLDLVAGHFRIERFSYVDDKGDLHENEPLGEAGVTANFECQMGCGIFEMTKL
jgi:SAM-dependent methyltransferase